MPEISRFYGIIITMYSAEHNPPHFHVYYGDKECVIDIQECAMVEGDMPQNKLRLVLAWCEIHKDELMQNWELAMKEKKLKKI